MQSDKYRRFRLFVSCGAVIQDCFNETFDVFMYAEGRGQYHSLFDAVPVAVERVKKQREEKGQPIDHLDEAFLEERVEYELKKSKLVTQSGLPRE